MLDSFNVLTDFANGNFVSLCCLRSVTLFVVIRILPVSKASNLLQKCFLLCRLLPTAREGQSL